MPRLMRVGGLVLVLVAFAAPAPAQPARGGEPPVVVEPRDVSQPTWGTVSDVVHIVQAVQFYPPQTAEGFTIDGQPGLAGTSFPGGPVGVLVLVLASALLGAAFAALSNALALVARQRESLIGAVTFVVLPLTFLSTALMRGDLLPGWMQTVTNVNPVDWAIEAGRQATGASVDWGVVLADLGFLAALLAACAWLAVRAFGSYQRSV